MVPTVHPAAQPASPAVIHVLDREGDRRCTSAVFNGNTKFLPDKSPGSDVQKKAFERAVCLRDEAVGDMSSGRFSRPRGAVLLILDQDAL